MQIPGAEDIGLCKSLNAHLTSEWLLGWHRGYPLIVDVPLSPTVRGERPAREEHLWPPSLCFRFGLGGRAVTATLMSLRSHCCQGLLQGVLKISLFRSKTDKLKVINYVLDPGNIVCNFGVDPVPLCFPTIHGTPGHYSSHKPSLCLVI